MQSLIPHVPSGKIGIVLLQSNFHEQIATSYAIARCELRGEFSSFQPKPCLLPKITLNRPLTIQILYRRHLTEREVDPHDVT